MNRYNQGFLKFGPMEQCDDGEWVKACDHDNAVKRSYTSLNASLILMGSLAFSVGVTVGMVIMPMLKEYVYQIWPEVWL